MCRKIHNCLGNYSDDILKQLLDTSSFGEHRVEKQQDPSLRLSRMEALSRVSSGFRALRQLSS